MQKFLILQVAALLAVLLSGTQVDAFVVSLTRVTLTADFEDGGLHEVGVACILNDDDISAAELIPDVRTPGVEYDLDPVVVIDESLGAADIHQCLLIELDSFDPNEFNDPDSEDDVDDPVCAFTIQQSDFVDKVAVMDVTGCTVTLECDEC